MVIMDIKRAGIISNPKKDLNLEAAAATADSLRRHGVKVMFDNDSLPYGEHEKIDFGSVDCLFVLGGGRNDIKGRVKSVQTRHSNTRR